MHTGVQSIKTVMVIIIRPIAKYIYWKSTGIVEMTKYWRELGHIVVNLDLKGFCYAVSGKHAMMVISGQLKNQLLLFDTGS